MEYKMAEVPVGDYRPDGKSASITYPAFLVCPAS
jgi:hypothetical protein